MLAALPLACGRGDDTITPAGVQTLLVRPAWASLGGELSGQVKTVWFRGAYSHHLVETALGEVLIREPGRSRCRVGEPVSWHLHRVWVLPHSSRDVVPG